MLIFLLNTIVFSATTTYSFVVWDFDNIISRSNHEKEKKKGPDEDDAKKDEEEVSREINKTEYQNVSKYNVISLQDEKIDEPEKDLKLEGIVLKLPHTIRNISTKMTLSNSFMISNNNAYAVAGVR